MNSILQCLSNTRFLTEYCLQGVYSNDLNTTMSVMKGSLFRSYAALIKTMWKNDDVLVSPQGNKSFKVFFGHIKYFFQIINTEKYINFNWSFEKLFS